ncbi:copper homeostasis membrane protein CopD [Sphingorhabdus sp.]|uniref:copper homeostasis membrane protein CopD n=1 Tax=Sphingorhabdus sp. TaxID=1902408 RepID=UPI003BB0C837
MEPAGIALRLLVYLDTALLLGILLFSASWTRQVRLATAVFAAVGMVLTTLTMLRLAASFSDRAAFFDIPTLQLLLTETAMGWAAIARLAALLAVAVLALSSAKRFYTILFALIASVSLSWNGHGAMTDQALGWLHLAGNALHLLAGLGWIGALAAFLWAATLSKGSPHDLAVSLERFAGVGTVFVAVLLATGIANTLFIVGANALPTLLETTYGRLLLTKIGLFAAMLAAAAANRLWLTPRLIASPSLTAVRTSLGAELLLGIAVLAIVAWLGTLDPSL